MKIGLIGLGQMGLPMARNLLSAGHSVVGYRRGSMDQFVALGGIPASSPRDVANQCENILCCITDSAALADVVSGPQGIASGDCSGRLLVELSTLATADKRIQADRIEACGGRMLDGAISGLPNMVADKVAVFFISGTVELYESVREILDVLSTRVFYMGEFGAAMSTKLCANMLVAINIAAAAETIAFGQKMGLDPLKLVAALKDGAGGSLQFSARAGRMAVGDWDNVLAPLALLLRDIELMVERSGKVDCTLSILAPATELYRQAIASGYGSRDGGAVYAAVALREGLAIPIAKTDQRS